MALLTQSNRYTF